MKYELKDDLLTGNAMIDTQHKELFAAVNNLLEACSSGRGRDHLATTVSFLQNYITKHFNDEEQLQASVSYPELMSHKHFHASYKQTIQKISQSLLLNGPTISVLADLNRELSVLLNHIRTEDKKIATFIKSS